MNNKNDRLQAKLLFRPHFSEGGGLYAQMVFFVQSFFTDRYIHRRGLCVVPLESPSSIEYKTIFF